MEVIEYIKKTHKKYIGDNPKADYYNNKYIYEFKYLSSEHYGEDIDYFYKNNIYNKYDDIIIDIDDYKYETDEYGFDITFLNDEIYVDNDFLIYFINNYKKYDYSVIFNLYPIFICKKIIINFDYELIQQKISNTNYNFKFYFHSNTIIFENGFFNCCECKNFICNSEKIINEFFD